MSCKHEIVYKGVINVSEAASMVGAIDVWKCRKCEKLFVEERRLGETKLEPKLGFEELYEGYKWTLLVCRALGTLEWSIYKVKENHEFEHLCPFLGKVKIKVDSNFYIQSHYEGGVEHRLYLLEDYINKVLEVSV
ncbi:MAG: hypothetical protein QXX95_03355 [Nitrososphaerales archaeon]